MRITGTDYHRCYRHNQRGRGDNEYFREWNKGNIKGKDLDESKIFNCYDLYYIKQTLGK